MPASLTNADDIKKHLNLITAQINVLHALLDLHAGSSSSSSSSSSPWLPLAEAAAALHFPNSRSLRNAINRGRIPTEYVSATVGETGKRRTLYVDVEGFASHLRNASNVVNA